ncbi:hypothetical protein K3495_g3952 [Podosphaera aphanis]|nr:hypothetical protein K3495_g3952 [Podosphaera aphanis]
MHDALTAAVGVSPTAILPSRDNEAYPNSPSTTWIARFPLSHQYSPSVTLLFNAPDAGSDITPAPALLLLGVVFAAPLSTPKTDTATNAQLPPSMSAPRAVFIATAPTLPMTSNANYDPKLLALRKLKPK